MNGPALAMQNPGQGKQNQFQITPPVDLRLRRKTLSVLLRTDPETARERTYSGRPNSSLGGGGQAGLTVSDSDLLVLDQPV